MQIEEIIQAQRTFFATGATKAGSFRVNALIRLRTEILQKEQRIYDALKEDLNKSEFESYMTEIGMVLNELRYAIRHVKKWTKKKTVYTPIAQFHSKSFIMPEPYGVALILSPWNYPFQLTFAPLIGAISSGNCAILKPSAYAPKTSKIISDIVTDCFPPNYITVVLGGRQENEDLLKQRFDFIFFTGGVTVGKLVMEFASKNLTPVCLELGGKSPCIIDKTADLITAAKRIAFGKFLNAGQTCVAPDYLFVHRSVKDELVKNLKKEIENFYGADPLKNENYPKIINEKHYKRLRNLMEDETVLIGGQAGDQKITPTVLDGITAQSRIM
ncbi:MAG: aldehyde dehydrogenase family protein, partial [Clostridiales bacterium]|nr:aldehyde dehydrogenase family protein [Clostridiales bacterium]